MKTRILIKDGEYKLSRAGCMDAKIDAEELYCFLTGLDKVTLFLKAEEEVDKETEEKYYELIKQRASRIPLQHITGHQEFMGFDFKVSPDVLIPRQDTETLVVEAGRVIQRLQKLEAENQGFFKRMRGKSDISVLDMCCGSGAVGISLAKICGNIDVVGSDISPEAIAIAKENAKALRVDMKFACGDMFKPLDEKPFNTPRFDVIVSNPPYIRTSIIPMLQEEVKFHEPMQALDGGKDGLDYYETILWQAPFYLKPEGWLLMEIGYDQGEDLKRMIRANKKYYMPEILQDLPGKDRVVKTQLK